jgi:hypothetical protein
LYMLPQRKLRIDGCRYMLLLLWMPWRSGRILSLLVSLIWSIVSLTTAQGNLHETGGIRALSPLWWPQATWQDNLQC